MAESISIRTDAADYVAGGYGQEHEVGVKTFFGGEKRGRMVQVTIGREYVCMTQASAEALALVIQFASRHSLSEYPVPLH